MKLFKVLLLLPCFLWANNPTQEISKILDDLHLAAAEADGDSYFKLFRPDAIYIGTDATETWTIEEFKRFAKPYFDQGRGWVYTPTDRKVTLSEQGNTAWFVELLWNEKYGQSRGSGVLVKQTDGWKIAQYHLTFPIPNELAKEITQQIKQHTRQPLKEYES